MTIFREGATSVSWFPCVSSILVKLEFEHVGFCGGRKTKEPGEKLSGQGENQQQPQPTCGQHWAGIKPGHTGGKRGLSPLCHPCCLTEQSCCHVSWVLACQNFLPGLGSSKVYSVFVLAWNLSGIEVLFQPVKQASSQVFTTFQHEQYM